MSNTIIRETPRSRESEGECEGLVLNLRIEQTISHTRIARRNAVRVRVPSPLNSVAHIDVDGLR